MAALTHCKDMRTACLDDQLPEGVSLFDLAVDVPAGWGVQKQISD